MPKPRPTQPETPPADAFEIHRAEVAPGLSLAYLREGAGGYPLLLIHGYPETKRIWWRNVLPLARAGDVDPGHAGNQDQFTAQEIDGILHFAVAVAGTGHRVH